MLALIAGSIYLAATTDRADKALVAVASPDGKYKAVRLTVSNDTPVNVLRRYDCDFSYRLSGQLRRQQQRLSGLYRAVRRARPNATRFPKIEWLANNKLQITYSPESGAGKAPRLKERDMSLFVDIDYVKVE